MIKLKDFMKVLYPYQLIEIYVMNTREKIYTYDKNKHAEFELRTVEIARNEITNKSVDRLKLIVSI